MEVMHPLPLEVEAVPLGRRRALVISNQIARSVAGNVDRVFTALHDHGFELLRPTLTSRDATANLIRAHADAADLVIAIGGDGTLNATLQGLIGTNLPLGIVPLGTANDLCKTLGIAPDPIAACDVIAAGKTRRIDVGRVNGIYYFNEASIGLSVALARRLTRESKARFGVAALLIEAVRILLRMRRF